MGPVLFLIYMNDITSSIRHSQLLMYADDTITETPLIYITDQILLQEDINAIFIINWSKSSQLNFNISKCIHLSLKSKSTAYYLSDTAVSTTNSQKDFGLIF